MKEAHEIRGGAPGHIPGVSSLFILQIGGVERGESTISRRIYTSYNER